MPPARAQHAQDDSVVSPLGPRRGDCAEQHREPREHSYRRRGERRQPDLVEQLARLFEDGAGFDHAG